jgi:hypothetical protein
MLASSSEMPGSTDHTYVKAPRIRINL